MKVLHHARRLPTPPAGGVAQAAGFAGGHHRQPLTARGQQRASDGHGPVAVGIRLQHGEDRAALGPPRELRGVGAQRSVINSRLPARTPHGRKGTRPQRFDTSPALTEVPPEDPPVSDGTLELVINGEPSAVPDGCTVASLVARLGLERDRIAVAVNRDVVPRSAFPAQTLSAGDRVEILEAVGGG